MKRFVFIYIATIVCAYGGTYWVSPNGEAAWVNAASETALSGTSCTTLSTANANAVAGDTVMFRGGTYNISPSTYTGAIHPTGSGTDALPLTYQAYTAGTWADREVPFFLHATPHPGFVGGYNYGIRLVQKTNVVVKGFVFEDFDFWTSAVGCYKVEIGYCEFYTTDEYIANGGSSFGVFFYKDGTNQSTHNWIHNNVLHNLTSPAPAEAGDLIRIGSYSSGDDGSNNNTIESNLLYSAGHTLTDCFSHYNVWRANIGVNYGFKPDPNLSGTAIAGGAWTMTASGVNFATDFTGLGGPSVVGLYIHDLDDIGTFGAKLGTVVSLSTTTTANDTIIYTNTYGAGTYPTFAAGHRYVVGTLYLTESNSPASGKFAHRAFHTDSFTRQGKDFNLFEGNRLGYASPNPGNNGANGLELSSGSCIVRYNAMFGNSGMGLYFKNGLASANNRVYNNTLFSNGRFSGVQHPVAPISKIDLYIASLNSSNGAVKNCIFWGSPLNMSSVPTVTTSSNLASVADSYCSVTGDPLFVNTNLLDVTNTALPDLTLLVGSAAIDKGGWLTLASGSGTGSTTLIVDDALYFQDGTWGSALAGHQADVIAVGSKENRTQIASIDYASNTITLANALTWSDDAPVYLYAKNDGTVVWSGSAPDIGAYEYTATSRKATIGRATLGRGTF